MNNQRADIEKARHFRQAFSERKVGLVLYIILRLMSPVAGLVVSLIYLFA